MDFGYLDALIEADLDKAVEIETGGVYRHVWVLAEVNKQDILRASLAALGQGCDIADQFGVYLFAVLLGHRLDNRLAETLGAYGADQVLLVDDPALAQYQVETYTTTLANLISERQPEILLLPATPLGNDLAPRLAQRLETGLISHCVQLGLDMAERQLLGTVARMHGDYFHTLACPQARPQLATLEPDAFHLPYTDAGRSPIVERIAPGLDGAKGRLRWVEMDTAVTPAVKPLAESHIIVAAGRGLQDAEGFALAEQLAVALGGQVAGSRGALDEGWIDVEQQVGITGQTVKPDLYIACGISGAIQHLVGIQETRFVIAINSDENAPIMQRANLGAVGDVKAILRALLASLKR
ncbi:MAG: electron transfer flavoprotein subunit alpha [Chloroflexi bacterium]|jgi:electron transfer flavoprotein alpha subunit|nr:electron transfer flavoprotein subunit alpha [Chloroflexota bacterium]